MIVMAGYIAVSVAVFVSPTRSNPPAELSVQVAAGAHVWRQNNCESCHALYGLGGHIGPDLTNIIKWRGTAYVQGMLLAGRPGMPAFAHLPANDMADLMAYLTVVNGTGEFPQHARPLKAFGQVQ